VLTYWNKALAISCLFISGLKIKKVLRIQWCTPNEESLQNTKKPKKIFSRKRNGTEKVTESGVGSALFLIEWERSLKKQD
jgi:hypothetical protein